MSQAVFSSAVMFRARELKEAGFFPAEIVEALRREGHVVSRTTVKRWIDPKFDERARRSKREAARRSRARRTAGRLRGNYSTDEQKHARIVALREEAGLSVNAIAKVMNFDGLGPLTGRQVEYLLKKEQGGLDLAHPA